MAPSPTAGPATLEELVVAAARPDGDAIAVAAPGRPGLGYARLLEHLRLTSASIERAGIRAGDRIAIVLPNGPEMATAFLAASFVGTSAPLNPAYRESELDFYLSDLDAKALIVAADEEGPAVSAARAREIPVLRAVVPEDAPAGVFEISSEGSVTPGKPSPAPEDVALVLHTSGTTSRPKMVPLTHANLCASARSVARALELRPGDRCLNVMPLFHIHGLVGATLSSLAAGATLIATPGFDATALAGWLAELEPTWYTAVPTMHQAMLARLEREGAPRHSLRLVRSSSAALPSRVMERLEELLGVPVLESYGMTEAAHQMTSNPMPPGERKPGSVGPAAGPEVAIMGADGSLLASGRTGEVVIRGPNVTGGYAAADEINRAAFTDGWFRTGDLGDLDPDGYLHLRGRIKEIINRGGETISPIEIDEALMEHPAVAQVATFALPDARLGEDVGAAVVVREGSDVDEEALRSHVAALLSDAKVPRRIVFLDAIPKGPTGKLQRIGLAERLGLVPDEREAAAFEEPHAGIEARIAELFGHTLHIERVGRHDDFFDLGGDSILAVRLSGLMRSELGRDLPVHRLFREPTVAGLAGLIEELPEALADAPSSGATEAPLTPAQRALWVFERLVPGTPTHGRAGAIALHGALDTGALARVLDALRERHAALRSRVEVRDARPVQVHEPHVARPLPAEDLTGLPGEDRVQRLRELFREEAKKPHDLERGPVMRAQLVRLEDEEHALLVNVHHAFFDGWSMDLFLEDLMALYESEVKGAERPPAPTHQYTDHALHASEAYADVASAAQYWRERLAGAPRLELPRDGDETLEAWRGGSLRIIRKAGELLAAGRVLGATPFVTLLSAFQVFLFRLSSCEDVVLGTLVSGREAPGAERTIGLFAEPLVLRGDLSGDPTFAELVGRLRETVLAAFEHRLPFEEVVRAARPPAQPGRSPFYDVLFQQRNFHSDPPRAAGLRVEELALETGIARAGLFVECDVVDERVETRFEFRRASFDPVTVKAWASIWSLLLGRLGSRPDTRLSEL